METLSDPDYIYAVSAGVLASVACGVVGSFVVVKRIVFIAGGISHASLGGVGLAVLLGVSPILGAGVFSVLSALLLGAATRHQREQPDVIIGALWALGMGFGIACIELSGNLDIELEHFLIGSVEHANFRGLAVSGALLAVVLAGVAGFYKELVAVSLDEEFAELRGLPVGVFYSLLLCLVALTVVAMIQIVGIILVIALLSLPPATSRWFTHGLVGMMALACLLGTVYTVLGLTVSHLATLPPGVCVVTFAVAGYAVGRVLDQTRSRTAPASAQ